MNKRLKEILSKVDIEKVVEVSIKRVIPILPASMSKMEDINLSDDFPVIIDNRNVIIEGHGTYWYNIQNGAKTIKVIYIDRPPKKLLHKVSKRIESLLKRKHVEDVGTDPILNINPVYGFSLNKINDDISTYMSTNGFRVESNERKGDIFLQHYAGKPVGTFKSNILIQPVDGTKIRQSIIDIMNTYDHIICPAYNSLRILKENGVYKPIEVIPNYYEPFSELEGEKKGKSNGYFDNITKSNKKYTFYSETTGIKRKNVENILKYYLETFTQEDNVRLIIKLASSNGIYDRLISTIKDNDPEVIIINSFISDTDLNDIRKNIDCYVCLSYMEGFCIPLLNALVLGKDAIALKSRHSGYMDYVDNSNVYLLPSIEIDIDESVESLLIYDKDSRWEEVENYDLFKTAMKDVVDGKYNFDKGQKLNDLMGRFGKNNVMYHYRKLFISAIEGYNVKLSTHNWTSQRIVNTFEKKIFFNPIASDIKFVPISQDIYRQLTIFTIKSLKFDTIKSIDDYFGVVITFEDVNAEGQIQQLKGSFYMRRDAEDKWTFKGEKSVFGKTEINTTFIEIHTTEDISKMSSYVIPEKIYVSGNLTVKTGEVTYTYAPEKDEKPIETSQTSEIKNSALVVTFDKNEYEITIFTGEGKNIQGTDIDNNVKLYLKEDSWNLEINGKLFLYKNDSPFGEYSSIEDNKIIATVSRKTKDEVDNKEENKEKENDKKEEEKGK